MLPSSILNSNILVFRSLLALAAFSTLVSASSSAWHGYLSPGSATPEPFRPYYVPAGSKSFDNLDPSVVYQGSWSKSTSDDYVDHTLSYTTSKGASCTFTFTGTGVEVFGNTGKNSSIATVYLDGKRVGTFDGYDTTSRVQQRLWSVLDIPNGKHQLKIVNSGRRKKHGRTGQVLDIDAFVVIGDLGSSAPSPQKAPSSSKSPSSSVDNQSDNDRTTASVLPSGLIGDWSLEQIGNTGVAAMQMAVISPTRVVLIDKVEHNPATFNGHPAWAAIYDFSENQAYPIQITSNSFCAGGTFLSNGTLVNVGGNQVVEDYTNSADFGDTNGMQGIRILQSCTQSGNPADCMLYEDPPRIHMASARWYPTVVRISDGSAMMIGGAIAGGWINNASTNNPTYEFFPPKGDGTPVQSAFLQNTLHANLFPIAFSLPDGRVFIAANQDAIIYDWKNNVETQLPTIPNGVRVTYPMAGTGILLPLDPANNYTPEIMLCGGSTLSDTLAEKQISTQDPASNQCSRLVLTDAGIQAGWSVEQMPEARLMPDAVLLPSGDIFIVNGAGSGISGYGNVNDLVGQSNADNPVFTPVVYSPTAPSGSRFTTSGMPTSDIARLYHSVATLVPDGHVVVAGSNPNLDRSTIKYQTEYRVEHFGPPYMNMTRPSVSGVPGRMDFGQTFTMTLDSPVDVSKMKGEESCSFQSP